MSYKMMSGIETHVEFSTASKIFCGCRVKFGAEPNTQCCAVCTGQPGALPVLNKNAVRLGILAGLCLNCTINGRTRFARKNYFYPDLPKAYQISQQELPLCENGYVELESGKKIRITRIHLEEDAGKLVHEGDSTFIDYNRCGVPLIEIVSAPDISSPKEAREYIEALQSVLRFAGVSDCRMQQGSMRCDVNISVAEEGAPAGTRTELKNLNSVSAVERAMEHEFLRQCNILSGGGRVEQSTLRYDEKSGATVAMRAKEDARDYRYFPEPDIPDIVIPPSEVALIKKSLPRLPAQRLAEYTSLGVGGNAARLLCRYRRACDFFESCLKLGAGAKTAANLIVGQVFARADIHRAVYLARVGTDDFGIEAGRQGDGQRGFARSGGAQYGYQVKHRSRLKSDVFVTVFGTRGRCVPAAGLRCGGSRRARWGRRTRYSFLAGDAA